MDNKNYDQLIEKASQKLGISTEQLRRTLEKGDVKALSQGLSKSDKEKLRSVLSNKELMEKLKNASTPEDLMKLLGKR